MTAPEDPRQAGEPAPDAVLAIDPEALLRALPGLPDDLNALLRLADGRRNAREIAEASGRPAAEVGGALARLLECGALRLAGPGTPAPEAADWFAHPAEPEPPRLAEPESRLPVHLDGPPATPGPVAPVAEASPGPGPAGDPGAATEPGPDAPAEDAVASPSRPDRSRTWLAVAFAVVGAAVALGLLAVSGGSRRQEGVRPPGPVAAAAPGSPPALAMTEPRIPADVGEALARARERLAAGDPAAAAQACRKAIEADPSSGPAWALLGEIHLAAGDPARARAALERSLAVDPSGPSAPAARASLERLRP